MNITNPTKVYLSQCPFCAQCPPVTGLTCAGHPPESLTLLPSAAGQASGSIWVQPLTEERVLQLIAERIGNGLKVTYEDSEARLRGIAQDRMRDWLTTYAEGRTREIATEVIQAQVVDRGEDFNNLMRRDQVFALIDRRIAETDARVRDHLDEHWRSMWAQTSDSSLGGECELDMKIRRALASFLDDHRNWFAARIREEVAKVQAGTLIGGKAGAEWQALKDEIALRGVNSTPVVDAVAGQAFEIAACEAERNVHLLPPDGDASKWLRAAALRIRDLKLTPAAQCVGLESERPNGKADAPPTELPDRSLSEYQQAAIAFAIADCAWHADPSQEMARRRDVERQRFAAAKEAHELMRKEAERG